jgi:MoaA/NifB/PqqE/SkfB family radical SAM enzyme
MVLGFILYETFDLVYNFGALTYNGTKYMYKWYYGIENETIVKEKEIEMLRLRIKFLEETLLTDRSSEYHKKAE